MRSNAARRFLDALKNEGPRGLGLRIKAQCRARLSHIHLLVFVFDSNDASAAGTSRKSERSPSDGVAAWHPQTEELEFKEVFLNDKEEIDGLTAIDPWNIPKSESVKKLNDKWRCYVAKSSQQVVACAWVIDSSSFNDEFLKRNFHLGGNEVYYTRCFSSPDSRGQGIFPRLMMHTVDCLSRKDQKTHHLTLVRTTNKAMRRCLAKICWKVVGRAGFIEFFGIRLHYLWGREAFRETKQRVFLQLNRKGS